MAELKTINTEQTILEVATKLFMEKGYSGTRTTEIAKVADVNHALLHYYFRTKENLFNQIFEQKSSQLVGFFITAFEGKGTFFEKLKKGVEMHFDCLSENPELPLFVLREVVQNKEKKEFIQGKIFPVVNGLLRKMHLALRQEIKKGAIRPVKANNLLLNIVSLNVFAFVAAQALFDIHEEKDQVKLKKFLEERKKNNVDVIIRSIKL